MRRFFIISSVVMAVVARGNPLSFPSYEQKVTASFATEREAEQVVAKITGLPDDARLAFCCRWDDSTPAHLAKGKMMQNAGYRGTFYLTGNPDFFTRIMPQLLAMGHGAGNHTLHHPFMMQITVNRAFREIMENKIDLERLTGYTVNSYVAPCGWGATIDDERRPLLARMLMDTGHFVSQDNPVPDAKLSPDLWYPTFRTHMDDRHPTEAQFTRELESCLKQVQSSPHIHCVTFGIHSWCNEEGNRVQERLLKSIRSHADWFYCTANEYGAYRYEFLNGGIEKASVNGKTVTFTIRRYRPAQLGERVPLSLHFTVNPVTVEHDGLALTQTKRGTWTLPHDKKMTMPSVIDCTTKEGTSAAFPGLSLSIVPDPASGKLELTLKNKTADVLSGVYGVVYLPPVWQVGRLTFEIPVVAAGGEIKKTFSMGAPCTRADYREGSVFYAAGVDFTRGTSACRLYAKRNIPQRTVRSGRTPRDAARIVGPFDVAKFDEAAVQAASLPGVPLTDFGTAVNEKWMRMIDPERTAATVYAYMPYGPLMNKPYMASICPLVEAKKGVRLIAFEFEAKKSGPVKLYCSVAKSTRSFLLLNGVKIMLQETVQDIPARAGRNRLILRADMQKCHIPDSVLVTVCEDGLSSPLECFPCKP